MQSIHTAFQTFISSASSFRVLFSFGPSSSLAIRSPPSSPSLYILDSSFNPPTQAHLRIATSALLQDQSANSSPKQLLLLLATQNADKASKPASFEQRLVMMNIFAQELRWTLKEKSEGNVNEEPNLSNDVIVDVGVTKKPYFHDKAIAIDDSGSYKSPETGAGPEQVYLIGFDTLIRLLDSKYYSPEQSLHALDPFFEKHRIRVTPRTDEGYGGRDEQALYVRALADGKREDEGGRKEWASKIELVEGRRAGEETVSSTKVREAVGKGDHEALGRFVTERVMHFILDYRLYVDKE